MYFHNKQHAKLNTLFSLNKSNGLLLSWPAIIHLRLHIFMKQVSKDVKVQL